MKKLLVALIALALTPSISFAAPIFTTIFSIFFLSKSFLLSINKCQLYLII